MDIIFIILAFAAGLFVPAPYDEIARNTFSSVWNWIKSWFNGGNA